MPESIEFQQRMRAVEELVRDIEGSADPRLRSKAVDLVAALMELQGAGLARMLELVEAAGPQSSATIDQFARDPLVSSLLVLHNLHPVPLETRVGQALEKVRPLLKSHGGNVQLLAIDGDVVRLRLEGSCHGCPSSLATLRGAIEEAMFEFAPDIAELQVEGLAPPVPQPAGFVPLEQLVSQ